MTYRRFVAAARHPGSLEAALLETGRGEASLHGIPGEALPDDPFGLDWWRGGLGIIATLVRERSAG